MNKAKKYSLIWPILLLVFAGVARSQTRDAGGIASVSVSQSFSKKWGAKIEQEFRFNQNYSVYSRAATSLGASYGLVPKRLKAEAEYVFIHQNVITSYEIRQRASLGLLAKIDYRQSDFSWQSRIQSTWRNEDYGDYKFNPKYVWRNKLKYSYTVFGSCYKPYVSAEIFCPLNTKNGMLLDGVRGVIGCEYRINKHSSVDLFYRIDQDLQKANSQTMFYTGVGWHYRL